MDSNDTTMEALVDEAWKEKFYGEVESAEHIVIGVILMFLTTFGLLGNLTVIYIFLTTKSLKTPSNLLLLNLSCIDLFMVITCQPMMMIASFQKEWKFGDFGCDAYGALTSFGGVGSIMGMTAIAYDRYIMICFAADANRIASRFRSFRIALMVWAYASIFAILPSFGIGGFIMDGFQTSCTFDYVTQDLTTRSFVIFMYIMVFMTPMTMNMYFYYSIFETVRNSGATDKKEKKQQNKELAIAKVGMTCVMFFAIAWSPYAIVGLVGQFSGPENIPPRLSTFPALFAKSACVYNAYIYGFLHPKYQYQIKKRFPCFQTPTEGSTTAGSQSAAN
ncbi:rhodopsin-like isoform X1 [Convolutriloba macropyga]|uniref:rhodopsin-like isoform X1 n=1 Tax=Convolutriloba macropyga TaxID=536237 RepID=UPI003F51B100